MSVIPSPGKAIEEYESNVNNYPHQVDDASLDIDDENQILDPITANDLYTKPRFMGMPATYFAVGIIYGGQSAIVYPLYVLVLNSPSNYVNAVGANVSVFWSFKIFYGFLSDTVPWFGLRRKPYILFGWVLSIIATMVQAIYLAASETELFCYSYAEADDDFTRIKKVNFTSGANGELSCPDYSDWQTISVSDETFNGSIFVLFMIATNLAYMFADVAADGLAVEYAKREPLNQRGRIQSYNYCCRFTSQTIFAAVTGFLLNTPIYGGNFTTGISLSGYMWVLAICQAIFYPFFVIMHEEQVSPKLLGTFRGKLGEVWRLLQNKAFSGLMFFNVIYNLFTGIGPVAGGQMAAYWVGVSNLFYTWSGIVQLIAVTLTVYINGKYFINYSWRCLQSFGLITSTIMGLLSLIIIYDVNRSPGFWLFTQVDSTILSMIGWLTSIWAVNEMAPPGLEGTALALATTSSNAAGQLANFFRNYIGGLFPLLVTQDPSVTFGDVSLEAELQDQFAYNLLITMIVNLFGLAFMWFLPNQKEQARRRFETWGDGLIFGIFGVAIISIAMFYSSVSNLSTMFCPCAKAWGGPGCMEGTCDYIEASP